MKAETKKLRSDIGSVIQVDVRILIPYIEREERVRESLRYIIIHSTQLVWMLVCVCVNASNSEVLLCMFIL